MRKGVSFSHCLHFTMVEFAYRGMPQPRTLSIFVERGGYGELPFRAHKPASALETNNVEFSDNNTKIAHEFF